VQNEIFDDVVSNGFPGGETMPAIFQPPPVAMMQEAAGDFEKPTGAAFDDVVLNPGSTKLLPGIGGGPGMTYNTVPITGEGGQVWYVVKDTPEDKAAAERWRAYLKSKERSQLEWLGDTVGEGLNFVKNVAAGVVNATIPGSDLGDAGNPGQIVGALVSFANPAGAVLGAISKGTMALNLGSIGKAVSSFVGTVGKANQFLTSPLGQIGSTLVGGLVSGAMQPAANVAYPGAIRTSPLVPDATIYPGWKTGLSGFGMTQAQGLLPIKVSTPAGTVDTTKSGAANNTVLIVAAAAAVLFFLLRGKK
jgi:hypothetical protein